MTTVTQIITDAYRQSNLLAIGATPTAPQQAEALRYLNRIVLSVLGNEAGENLQPFPIGRNNVSRPSGYPWYDTVPPSDWFVPLNTRLMLNLTQATEVYLSPVPEDGARLGVCDVSGNTATYNLTIHGNGRNIEGTDTLVINTNGLDREWFFREDLGNWVRSIPLNLADTFPFPSEFDDMFVTLLAMRINPSYGVQMDVQTAEIYKRSRSQFRARYHNIIEVHSEDGLIRLPRTANDRYMWGIRYGNFDPQGSFNRGYPW